MRAEIRFKKQVQPAFAVSEYGDLPIGSAPSGPDWDFNERSFVFSIKEGSLIRIKFFGVDLNDGDIEYVAINEQVVAKEPGTEGPTYKILQEKEGTAIEVSWPTPKSIPDWIPNWSIH